MRPLIVAVVAASAALLPTSANAYFQTGNELYSKCQGRADYERFMCLGMVVGHYDMMESLGYQCPGSMSYTQGQLYDIVLKFLRDNPKERHKAAAILVGAAYIEMGCRMAK